MVLPSSRKFIESKERKSMRKMGLEGKKAIVTGASEGIGKAIAESFLKAGGSVLLTGRDAKKLKVAMEQIHHSMPVTRSRTCAFPSDACDVIQAEATVEKALQEFGQVDILVNNVGCLMQKSIAESTVADFDRDFSVNVRSAVSHVHAVLEPMKRIGHGVIINISSLAAI
jgi:NADP-dependent 3-hydroxy acid dehydrogenase YdfG